MRKRFTSIITLATVTLLSSALLVPALAAQPAASTAPAVSPVIAATAVRVAAPAVATVATTPVAAAPVVKKAVAKATIKKAVKKATVKKAAAKKSTTRKTTAKKSAAATVKVAKVASSSDDLATAKRILANLKGTYKYLDGVTVTIGKTPGGYQAVSYYTVGRIVISPKHTASIQRILSHEIWHIIDWRDNGKINWRESVPPKNAADYRK